MLYTDLRSRHPCATKVQKQAKDWVNSFTSLKSKRDGYQPDKVTPYMEFKKLNKVTVAPKALANLPHS